MDSNENFEKVRAHLTTEELGKVFKYVSDNLVLACECLSTEALPQDSSLARYVQTSEETWQEMLVRLLNEKGMASPECYKKADVDRKLFSKIMGNKNHAPHKDTAVKLALALELTMKEAREMLEKAGYALSHSSRRDLAIEYFFLNRKYDLYELNYALQMLGEEPI